MSYKEAAFNTRTISDGTAKVSDAARALLRTNSAQPGKFEMDFPPYGRLGIEILQVKSSAARGRSLQQASEDMPLADVLKEILDKYNENHRRTLLGAGLGATFSTRRTFTDLIVEDRDKTGSGFISWSVDLHVHLAG